jgi:hypothetical protein
MQTKPTIQPRAPLDIGGRYGKIKNMILNTNSELYMQE